MKKCSITLILILVSFVSYFVGGWEDVETSNDNYLLKDLSLDEKIGQMLFVEYRTSLYTPTFYESIYKYKPGGFILYSENLENYDEYFELIRKLNLSSDIPIFIGIDQEGGRMQRLQVLGNTKLTRVKSLEELGKYNFDYVFNTGKVISDELASFGINVNFSPVLDIASTDMDDFTFSRSFSTDKDLVAEYGKNYILGLSNGSVIPCAKHLPGIGDGTEDTHVDSSYIYKSRKELEEKELVPFKRVSNLVDMMMISHDIIPSITGDMPLTLSKGGIDYLQNYLDYDGLIVSDGLRMRALTSYFSTEEILVGSINAGVDILLAPVKMSEAIGIIKSAVLDGRISEDRIDEAVEKILRVKSKLNGKQQRLDDFTASYHNLLLKNKASDYYSLIDNYRMFSR